MKAEIQVFVKYVSTFGAIIYLGNLTLLFVAANMTGSATYQLDFLGHWVEPWLIPLITIGLVVSLYWDRLPEKKRIPASP